MNWISWHHPRVRRHRTTTLTPLHLLLIVVLLFSAGLIVGLGSAQGATKHAIASRGGTVTYVVQTKGAQHCAVRSSVITASRKCSTGLRWALRIPANNGRARTLSLRFTVSTARATVTQNTTVSQIGVSNAQDEPTSTTEAPGITPPVTDPTSTTQAPSDTTTTSTTEPTTTTQPALVAPTLIDAGKPGLRLAVGWNFAYPNEIVISFSSMLSPSLPVPADTTAMLGMESMTVSDGASCPSISVPWDLVFTCTTTQSHSTPWTATLIYSGTTYTDAAGEIVTLDPETTHWVITVDSHSQAYVASEVHA